MSEKIKQEIKEMVTKLANANLEFTIEDELEFAKVAVKNAEQKLRAKEQECERLSKYSLGFAKKCQRLELDILHLKDENNRFKRELQPFNDDYFKDLDTKTIAELAKKSIRLTTENRKLENALDEIEEYINTQLDELPVNKIKDIINGAKDIKVPHKAKE